MEVELTPQQIFNAEDPEISVPRDLIRHTKTREKIIEDLIKLDYKRENAISFVERVEAQIDIVKDNPELINEMRKESRKYSFLGLCLMLVSAGLFIVGLSGSFIIISGGLFITGFAFILKSDSEIKSLTQIQKLLKENDSLN